MRRLGPDSKRRDSLKYVGAGLVGGLAGYALGLTGATTGLGEQIATSLLKKKIAFGAGTNLKFMPDSAGNPNIPIREVFAFTPDFVQCQVEDNPTDFVVQTYELGKVVVKAHEFYMVMVSDAMASMDFDEDAKGNQRATIREKLSCFTEAATASIRIGSKTSAELAEFRAVAVDAGAGGGRVGDSFAITTFFNNTSAPVNHSIFGPDVTFTGKMLTGEVTITRLEQLSR